MTSTITVVGLGPGHPQRVTDETLTAIKNIPHRFLRTVQHPSAHLVADATSFDHYYDTLESFDAIYKAITDDLIQAAHTHKHILYAVPGSPLVLENTVQQLRQLTDIVVEVLPAISFLDEVWRALTIDPVEHSVRFIDGHSFAVSAANERGPLLVAHTHANWVISDIKLSIDEIDPTTEVVILHHLGLPDEQIIRTTWAQMDQNIDADHLTSLYIPHLAEPVASELIAFHQLARTLREECPWDREQTHQSLIRYLIEETYEVVDALLRLDPANPATDDDLIEELGDLLYQIEFHATIAEQEGRFTMADVARNVREKLTRRHPHVFGHVVATTTGEVLTNWEDLKKAEKPERQGPFDGVVEGAPSLTYAQKVQQKAKRVGFDWPSVDGPLQKVSEETTELLDAIDQSRTGNETADGTTENIEEEIGDLFFAMVNVARHLDIDAESALRAATQKFRSRVEAVQGLAQKQGKDMKDMSLEELDSLWNTVKKGSTH